MENSTLENDYKLIASATHEAVRSFSAHECHVVPPMFSELSCEAQQVLTQSCKDALAGMTKEEFHDKWAERKLERGWVYGDDFSLDNKTHPALLPHFSLPPKYRKKNEMFWEVARSVGRAIGMPVAEVIREG